MTLSRALKSYYKHRDAINARRRARNVPQPALTEQEEYIKRETARLLDGRPHLCHCGCGRLTKKYRGRWNRFVSGHNDARTRHGLSKLFPNEYQIYRSAKNRCINRKLAEYHCYGGRGIKFLFLSFEQFIFNLGRRPSIYHSLERKDNDGNYSVANCVWETHDVQNLNKRHGNGSVPSPPTTYGEPLY